MFARGGRCDVAQAERLNRARVPETIEEELWGIGEQDSHGWEATTQLWTVKNTYADQYKVDLTSHPF